MKVGRLSDRRAAFDGLLSAAALYQLQRGANAGRQLRIRSQCGTADVAAPRRDPQPFSAPLLRARRRRGRCAGGASVRRLAAGRGVRRAFAALAARAEAAP